MRGEFKLALIGFGAGHGDNSANRGPTGYREGPAMKAFLMEIKNAFDKAGEDVALIRQGSSDLSFQKRAKSAKDEGVRCYISLHTDSTAGVKVLHSVKNPEQKDIAEYIGNKVAADMGLNVKYIRARRSTVDSSRDYYGILRNLKLAGVPFCFIVEHGGHGDRTEEALLKNPNTFKSLSEMYLDLYKNYLKPLALGSLFLKIGKNNDAVKILQNMLNRLGHGSLDEDGVFGEKTNAALKEFQRVNTLTADGILGYMTADSIVKQINKTADDKDDDKIINNIEIDDAAHTIDIDNNKLLISIPEMQIGDAGDAVSWLKSNITVQREAEAVDRMVNDDQYDDSTAQIIRLIRHNEGLQYGDLADKELLIKLFERNMGNIPEEFLKAERNDI